MIVKNWRKLTTRRVSLRQVRMFLISSGYWEKGEPSKLSLMHGLGIKRSGNLFWNKVRFSLLLKKKRKENLANYKRYFFNAGFWSAEDYYKGRHWADLLQGYFSRHPKQCYCGKRDSKVTLFHKNYLKLGREEDTDVVSLCPKCYNKINSLIKKGIVPLERAHLWLGN